MPRKSTRAKIIEHLQQQKNTAEIQRASSTVSGNLFHQNVLEEEDESDGLGEFDEDMEIFAPKGTEDVEVPPWWKTNATTPSLYPTETDLLLAYVASIRYVESRSKGLTKGTTIMEWSLLLAVGRC